MEDLRGFQNFGEWGMGDLASFIKAESSLHFWRVGILYLTQRRKGHKGTKKTRPHLIPESINQQMKDAGDFIQKTSEVFKILGNGGFHSKDLRGFQNSGKWGFHSKPRRSVRGFQNFGFKRPPRFSKFRGMGDFIQKTSEVFKIRGMGDFIQNLGGLGSKNFNSTGAPRLVSQSSIPAGQ